MLTEASDPWREIPLPDQKLNASSRRVDASLPRDIFWAVDVDRHCLLILQHAVSNKPKTRLPKLRGLQVESRTSDGGSLGLLIVRLMDDEQREIFHLLCLDIIEVTSRAKSEQEAIEWFIARTWRWHWLLRGGRGGRLSDEEQKGLLGELVVLRSILFPAIGVEKSLKSWTGPFGSPKDFEIGRVCVEAKAHRGAATPYITVSSEYQLDIEGIVALFLHISEITAAAGEDEHAVTVTEVVQLLLGEVRKHNASLDALLEQCLIAAGFNWTDDYSDTKWILGPEHIFEVKENFPRITPRMLPSGVSRVRYAVSLVDCEPFRSDRAALNNLIS